MRMCTSSLLRPLFFRFADKLEPKASALLLVYRGQAAVVLSVEPE